MSKINKFEGLSQTDQEALELGRRIKGTFHYMEVANLLDKALFMITTSPNLEHSPIPPHLLIESLFSLKWMFSEMKGGDIA